MKHSPLDGLHLELGARLIPFAGWSMPVQYPSGVTAEHRQTRESAALFDVSHMGQILLRPKERLELSSVQKVLTALETLIPVDLAGLEPYQQRYGFFTDEHGGILDDLMITRRSNDVFLVVNASNAADDFAHLHRHLGGQVDIIALEDRALLALQGPAAIDVMRQLDHRVDDLVFMTGASLCLDGIDCFVTRSGYTGEDGFEISVSANEATALARTLLGFVSVAPAGLGARDTLRLEAGLCLHGHDISPATTPVEAGLSWAIQKVRRVGGARAGGYPGAEVIDRQLSEGPTRCRVGLRSAGRIPVREEAALVNPDGTRVGEVTSGTITPTVGEPIAMGYVDAASSSVCTSLFGVVRGEHVEMTVSKLPFVSHRYVRRLTNNAGVPADYGNFKTSANSAHSANSADTSEATRS